VNFVTTSGGAGSSVNAMYTSTLRHLGWLEDVTPVTEIATFTDLDVDARFWAAIDLMDGLLSDG
jgi:hypothetical protein